MSLSNPHFQPWPLKMHNENVLRSSLPDILNLSSSLSPKGRKSMEVNRCECIPHYVGHPSPSHAHRGAICERHVLCWAKVRAPGRGLAHRTGLHQGLNSGTHKGLPQPVALGTVPVNPLCPHCSLLLVRHTPNEILGAWLGNAGAQGSQETPPTSHSEGAELRGRGPTPVRGLQGGTSAVGKETG